MNKHTLENAVNAQPDPLSAVCFYGTVRLAYRKGYPLTRAGDALSRPFQGRSR